MGRYQVIDEFAKGEGSFDLSQLFGPDLVLTLGYWLSIDPDGIFQESLRSGRQLDMMEKFAMDNRLIDFDPKRLKKEGVALLVDPLITDVMSKVKQYAMPFFVELKKCYDDQTNCK